jgi:hypothetical protein
MIRHSDNPPQMSFLLNCRMSFSTARRSPTQTPTQTITAGELSRFLYPSKCQIGTLVRGEDATCDAAHSAGGW